MKKQIGFFLILAGSLLAQTPEIVTAAFEKVNADTVHQYRFKKSVRASDNTQILQYDPTQEGSDCWQLISVNDQPPDKNQLREFYKEMSKNGKDSNKSLSFDTKDMKDFLLLQETSKIMEYAFAINGDEDDKMAENLKCSLCINKSDTTINRIAMLLTEPVSPMISVKIDEFRVEMVFDKIAETGSTLIKETQTRIKGKAMVFKEIDENVTEKYFDYQLVE
ncbi:MAG: hypothetical protein JXQ65_16730 [Candidatus Marinimicrobia bacterium]|nr:hypothetical protein [Candidatus Neomarinimicrobiota bacterium]